MSDILALCDRVRQIGYELHRYLGPGLLEKVYENGMANRLRKAGIQVTQQHPLTVFDEDGTPLGDYFADLFIEGVLIVEVKACKQVVAQHTAQILGYLRASRIRDGLLINFGAHNYYIRKFII